MNFGENSSLWRKTSYIKPMTNWTSNSAVLPSIMIWKWGNHPNHPISTKWLMHKNSAKSRGSKRGRSFTRTNNKLSGRQSEANTTKSPLPNSSRAKRKVQAKATWIISVSGSASPTARLSESSAPSPTPCARRALGAPTVPQSARTRCMRARSPRAHAAASSAHPHAHVR